jgi:hypothetical protein
LEAQRSELSRGNINLSLGVRKNKANTEDRMMKTFLTTAAAIATLALAGPVSAQMYQQQPIIPAPIYQPYPMYQGPVAQGPIYQVPVQPMPPPSAAQPSYISALPPWMQDDGSSSDYPVHNPGDVSGDWLNSQYQGGLPVSPPNGFPAPYIVR